jgi:hypothetical protein
MADTDLFLQLDKKIDRSPTAPKGRPLRRMPPAQPPVPLPAAPDQESADSLHATAQSNKPTQPTSAKTHHDVMTSLLHNVNLRTWRDVIENTETQNSALRLTSEERYAVEDMINELRRKEKIKTSMNEIARLGLLLLIHDFVKNKRASLLYRIKKA